MPSPKTLVPKPIIEATVTITVDGQKKTWRIPKAEFNLRSESSFDGITEKNKTILRVSGVAKEVNKDALS